MRGIIWVLMCGWVIDGPFEYVHSAGDDLDQGGQFSFDHMLRFVKLVGPFFSRRLRLV